MADRTSAEMAGRVITFLHEKDVDAEIIKGVWKIVSDADFHPQQAEINDLRKLYDLDLDWDEDD